MFPLLLDLLHELYIEIVLSSSKTSEEEAASY